MVCWLRAGNPKLPANKYQLHKELVAWLWALPLWLESPAARLAGLSDSLILPAYLFRALATDSQPISSLKLGSLAEICNDKSEHQKEARK